MYYLVRSFVRLTTLPFFPQEIPLSEILQVEQSRDYRNLSQGSNPHCFEIITATMVYYVGENNGSHYHSPALAASGVGIEVAQGWEKAIRQALMPVTPQPSVASAAGQGKDHSKFKIYQLSCARSIAFCLDEGMSENKLENCCDFFHKLKQQIKNLLSQWECHVSFTFSTYNGH